MLLVALGVTYSPGSTRRESSPDAQTVQFRQPLISSYPFTPEDTVPSGVELSGWLVLEDWLFSGPAGNKVVTERNSVVGQGQCLPPAAVQLTERWSAEGELIDNLAEDYGEQEAASIVMAHRRSYIGQSDLETMRHLGVQKLFVPLPWATFADALAEVDEERYGEHDPDGEAVVVQDPYYKDTARFVTLPRKWLRMFLRKCTALNLKVILEMHQYPGGEKLEPSSGTWPEPPKFWTANARAGNKSVPLTRIGHMLVRAMVDWVGRLEAKERNAVVGVSLMDDPAAGSRNAEWADEEQVLAWLATAADIFRRSTLPSLGVRLYIPLAETAFQDFWRTVPAWFQRTFSRNEEETWAVIAMHGYIAWSEDGCTGRVTEGAGYFCDQDMPSIIATLEACLQPPSDRFRKHFHGLRATAFSIGSYNSGLLGCGDHATQAVLLQTMLRTLRENGHEPFFNSWRAPFAPNFERGWSLKYIMGRERAREPFPCIQPEERGWKADGNWKPPIPHVVETEPEPAQGPQRAQSEDAGPAGDFLDGDDVEEEDYGKWASDGDLGGGFDGYDEGEEVDWDPWKAYA